MVLQFCVYCLLSLLIVFMLTSLLICHIITDCVPHIVYKNLWNANNPIYFFNQWFYCRPYGEFIQILNIYRLKRYLAISKREIAEIKIQAEYSCLFFPCVFFL